MKRFLYIFIYLSITLLVVSPSWAQEGKPTEAAQPKVIQKNPLQKITLKDGTIIKGEVIGFENNAYIVKTRHIGTIKINAVNLKSIEELNSQLYQSTEKTAPIQNTAISAAFGLQNVLSGNPNVLESDQNAPAYTPGQNLNMGSINQLQKDLMKDPQINNSMNELLSDPELLKLIMSQDLMNAALSMNPERIKSNPKVQELLENPQMQKLMKQIRVKMGTPLQQP